MTARRAGFAAAGFVAGVAFVAAVCASCASGPRAAAGGAFKACADADVTQLVDAAGTTLGKAVEQILQKDDADLETELAALGFQVGSDALNCALDSAAAAIAAQGSAAPAPMLHALTRARVVAGALKGVGK